MSLDAFQAKTQVERARRNIAQRTKYQARREQGACGICGKRSRTAHCKRCRAASAARGRHRIGITASQYAEALLKQGARCAICLSHQATLRKALAADHDHISGAFRGLLCHRCNTGLGMFLDEPKRLLAAVDYLLVCLRADDAAAKRASEPAES